MMKDWLNISIVTVIALIALAGVWVIADADRTDVIINAEDSPFIEDEFAYSDGDTVRVCRPAEGMKFMKITAEVVNMSGSDILFDLDDIVLDGDDGNTYAYCDATLGYAKLTGNAAEETGNTVSPVWEGNAPFTVVLFYEIPLGTYVSGYSYAGALDDGGVLFNYTPYS